MKSWCYLAQASINKLTTWKNQCVQPVIWVDEVWDIECYGIGKTLGINSQDMFSIKESKYSEASFLITL